MLGDQPPAPAGNAAVWLERAALFSGLLNREPVETGGVFVWWGVSQS